MFIVAIYTDYFTPSKFTENDEAYKLYLTGRFHWSKRTAKDLQKSIEYVERAIRLDDKFALAYAGLADSYVLLSANFYLL